MDNYRKLVIELVQAKPIIWDPTHRDYKNRDQRKQVWDSIDAQLKPPSGMHVNAKATWDRLTKSFSNALRRKKKRSGSGADSEIEWKFQKEMMFLLPAKQLRLSSGNLPDFDQEINLMDLSCDHIDSQDSTESQIVARELNIAVEEDYPIDQVTSSPQDSHTSSESQDQRLKHRRLKTRVVNKRRGEEIQSDAEILNILKQRQVKKSKESPRLDFFRSLMETVDLLDQYQFMNFQMDVIQALKKQKEKVDQQLRKDEQPIQYRHSQSSDASTSTDTFYNGFIMSGDGAKSECLFEAEEFSRISFQHHLPNGTVKEHNAECGVHTVIRALKEELSNMFDDIPAENQVWEYKNRILDNDSTLKDYNITGLDKRPARIIVR